MRWLLASFVAFCVGFFVLLCVIAYNVLDDEPIEIAQLDVTSAQEQKITGRIFKIATVIFSATPQTPQATEVLRPEDVNALISCIMKWDKGLNSLNAGKTSSKGHLSDGFGKDWGIVFKKGKFHLSLHYQLLNPGMFSYMVGSHLNGFMILGARYGREGLFLDVDKLTISSVEVPPVLSDLIKNHVVSVITNRLKKYNEYQKCITVAPRGQGMVITYLPYELQTILKNKNIE